MKKTLATLLAALLTVSAAAACQPGGDDTPDATTTAATTTAAPEGNDQTDAPTEDDTDAPTEDETDEATEGETETTVDETDETADETDEPAGPELDLGGRTFKMAAWWDLTPVEGQDEQTDQLIERYAEMEEEYNFTWEYVNIPWEDYQRTYITNSMAGDAIADLATVEFNWLYPNLSMNNFLADVSELESVDFTAEKWNQDILSLSTFDEATYGFDTGRPWPVGVMFWNKSMFEREGLPSIYDDFFDGNWTWDKMREYAEALTQDTDGDGVTDQWGLSGTNLLSAIVYSNGGQTIDTSDPMNPEFALLSDEALEAYQFVQEMANIDQTVELNPEGAEWDYAKTQFANGNVGMFSGQWWMVDSILEVSADEYGVVLFPKGPNAENYTSHSTATNIWTIPETVEDKEAAIALFDLRTEPLPDETPDDWRVYFEDRVMDAESVDVIQMLQEEGLTVIDPVSNFAGVVELSYSYNYQIEHGEETPQAAISAVADQAQNLIDTAMQRTPDDIVDVLTPDEEEGD